MQLPAFPAMPVLPFHPAAGAPPEAASSAPIRSAPPAPEELDAATTTQMIAVPAMPSPALPFHPAAGAPWDAASAAPSRPARPEEDEARSTLPNPAAPEPLAPPVASSAEIENAQPHRSLPGLPAPPPMLGPLAAATHVPSSFAAFAPVPRPGPLAAPVPAAAPAPPPAAAPEPPRELSIEEHATIAAEIAERRDPRAEVLRRHRLSEADFEANDRRVMEQVRRQSKVRSAHDAAYLAAVESFRGPIAARDYARIVVGLERGTSDDVLDELSIQRPALMPLVRVWTKKVAVDGRLADEVGALLETLRAA
jgi:hypothetical protein